MRRIDAKRFACRWLVLGGLSLAPTLGCEVTTTLGQLGDEVGGSESGLGSSDSGGSESGAGSGDSGGSESGSESGPSSSESGFDAMGDPTMGETGPPPMCMPKPGDDVCMLCQAEFCCFEMISCIDEPSCACMLDCEQNLPPPECGMFCMPDFEYFALLQCRDGPCAGVC